MQRFLQNGLASCLPHHGRVDEPAIANLQRRSLSGAVAVVPPLDEFMACDEVALGSGYVQWPLLSWFCRLNCVFLHAFSIARVVSETKAHTTAPDR